MKIYCSGLVLGLVSLVLGQDGELPITTTDVFVQSGEASESSIIIMARCNNEEASDVTLSYQADGGESMTAEATVDDSTDFTTSVLIGNLTSATEYTYSVSCTAGGSTVESMQGRFKTLLPEDAEEDVSFVWAADLAGQGWGRNPDLSITTVDGDTITGGYVIFDVMKATNPDFAVFQGDMIYADGAIPPVQAIPEEVGGGNWTNNPSLDFVAVTLDEFRANWKYNHGDEKFQSFLAETPIYVQWDDHEVTNNWYPGELLYEPLYINGTEVDTLYGFSLQAFFEFNPILGDQIYRKQRFGKHLEIFFPDLRTYRGSNVDNIRELNVMMGQAQQEWLMESIKESTATWKIISMHDPISLVTGGDGDYDSWSQNQCDVLGREGELVDLFGMIAESGIKNVVSITSDVHYTAVTTYDPANVCSEIANKPNFMPFYEFCIGPINAGAFGPQDLDESFGAEYEYVRAPETEGLPANLPPPNLQSFGHAAVSANGTLTVKLIDITGAVLYQKTMEPEASSSPEDGSSPATSSATTMRAGTALAMYMIIKAMLF